MTNVKLKTLIGLTILVLGACGKRAPLQSLNLEASEFGALAPAFSPEAVPSSFNEARLCFKRLRLKTAEDIESVDGVDLADDNVDLELGEVIINGTASVLGEVSVPAGDYRRIEVDLEDGCGSGYSLYVDNGSQLSTVDRITIKFDGDFTVDSETGAITLAFDRIIEGLAAASADADLKDAAEAISGDLWE